MEGWQSGQMQRTVNPSGKPYAGSNPAPSTKDLADFLEVTKIAVSRQFPKWFSIQPTTSRNPAAFFRFISTLTPSARRGSSEA